MDYVIYDLELNHNERKNRKRKGKRNFYEVIQIGAVKVRMIDGNMEIVQKYSSLVKPKKMLKLSPFIAKLTGIQQEQIEVAPELEDVLPEFKTFVGDDVMLISWGTQDKKMLYKSCEVVDLDKEWFKDKHVDIQKQISAKFCEPGKQISLRGVMKELNLEFVGTSHEAIYDAENTARVFACLFDELDLSDCLSKDTKNKMLTESGQEAV